GLGVIALTASTVGVNVCRARCDGDFRGASLPWLPLPRPNSTFDTVRVARNRASARSDVGEAARSRSLRNCAFIAVDGDVVVRPHAITINPAIGSSASLATLDDAAHIPYAAMPRSVATCRCTKRASTRSTYAATTWAWRPLAETCAV